MISNLRFNKNEFIHRWKRKNYALLPFFLVLPFLLELLIVFIGEFFGEGAIFTYILVFTLITCFFIFFIRLTRIIWVRRGSWIPVQSLRNPELARIRKKYLIITIISLLLLFTMVILFDRTFNSQYFYIFDILLVLFGALGVYTGARRGLISIKPWNIKGTTKFTEIIKNFLTRNNINRFYRESREMLHSSLDAAEFGFLYSRMLSFYEKNKFYAGFDDIAPVLVKFMIGKTIPLIILRKVLLRSITTEGSYEYLIARSKFIDQIFYRCLKQSFEQIVIFGSRFDTRSIRFGPENRKTEIFELDFPGTEKIKLDCYKKNKIPIPTNIHFIPIDFNKNSLKQTLDNVGFRSACKTLYILEGVTMFYTLETVEEILTYIKRHSGSGSKIIFDFVNTSDLVKKSQFFGFGIERQLLPGLLEKFGLSILDFITEKNLVIKFFPIVKTKTLVKIEDSLSLVVAEITDFNVSMKNKVDFPNF